ncbi:MAG TPA: hypothetical protein VG247_10535 [Pseudonocardiaceae bacterium]|jgi:hypothetical protein|nr:hypothetical protein [Pseudonocardiaceae bacterium]
MGDVAYTLTLMGLLGGGVAVGWTVLWVRDRITRNSSTATTWRPVPTRTDTPSFNRPRVR